MRPQPGHTHALSALGLAVTLLTAGVARADEAPPPVEIPAGPPPNAVSVPLSNPTLLFGPQRAATFGLGFGKIGDSSYFQFSGYLNLVFGKLTLGISAPFNLLSPFPKPDPADKASAYGGVLRSQDWPKPSVDNYGHYLALVRNIQWGNPQDPFYVQYGQFFGATMGHGTIMDRYDNALDVNNPKPGLAAAVNSSKYGGLEVFTDDIAWPSTTILAARAYARPLGIAGFGPAGQKWAVGVTYAEDRLAPRQLLPIGSIISSDAAAGLTLSPPTDPRQSATVWGVDTEYEVFRNDIFGLTPYIDINNERTSANSTGLHIGVLGRFSIPLANALRVWARLEYRLMQAGYIPDYFDALYDLQRSTYPVSATQSLDKASAALYLAPYGPQGFKQLKNGIYGEATFEVFNLVQAGGTYSAIPQVPESGNLMLFATLPHLGPVKVTAYYLRQNFDAATELFKFDNRTYLAGVVMVDLFGPLWAIVEVTRTYQSQESVDGVVSYTPITNYTVGLQSYLPF